MMKGPQWNIFISKLVFPQTSSWLSPATSPSLCPWAAWRRTSPCWAGCPPPSPWSSPAPGSPWCTPQVPSSDSPTDHSCTNQRSVYIVSTNQRSVLYCVNQPDNSVTCRRLSTACDHPPGPGTCLLHCPRDTRLHCSGNTSWDHQSPLCPDHSSTASDTPPGWSPSRPAPAAPSPRTSPRSPRSCPSLWPWHWSQHRSPPPLWADTLARSHWAPGLAASSVWAEQCHRRDCPCHSQGGCGSEPIRDQY